VRGAIAGERSPFDTRGLAILVFLVFAATCVALLGFEGLLRREATASPPAPPARQQTGSAPATGQAQAAAPTSTVLRTGDRGAAIRKVQHALGALGFYVSAPDGVYGPGTVAAVSAFQRSRGLPADGVVGRLTAGAIQDALLGGANGETGAIQAALAEAAQSGRLSPAGEKQARSILVQVLAALTRLPPDRGAVLRTVIQSVAGQEASGWNDARTLALVGTLRANARYLSSHPRGALPEAITDDQGLVYRWVPSFGFALHPLASFVHLNALAKAYDQVAAHRLAAALVGRGVRAGDTLTWEYYFPFHGPSRWISGLAQAVAAQALARTGKLGDHGLYAAARAAYRAIPETLSTPVAGGLWVREYSYSDMLILNAELQTILSLTEYADTTGDGAAKTVVGRLTKAARALLPQFDTGCWSLYSSGGSPASLSYHTYHVALLRKLAAPAGDALWTETASRWAGYLRASPAGRPSC